MKSSTARKLQQIPAGVLLVGIDPHQKQHAAVVMTQQAQVLKRFKVSHDQEGFTRLVQQVEEVVARTGATGAMYGIEAGSHLWRTLAYALESRGKPYRLINPFTAKRQREAEDLNKRKNDYRDAAAAAELLRTGKFTETRVPQGDLAELRAGYAAYRRERQQCTRTVNQVKGLLDGLFPEFCGVFKDVRGQTAQAVLVTGAIPADLARLTQEEAVARVRSAGFGRRVARRKLARLQELALESVGVRAGATAVAAEIKALVERLRQIQRQLEQWEQQVIRLAQGFPEYPLLASIVGLGPLSVAGILAELGSFAQYRTAKQLIKMAGTNPTEAESAGKRSAHSPMSKKGRTGLRWCLWMAAVGLLRLNSDFRAWAQALRERPGKGLKKGEAVGAVMNRLLRIAWGLVKRQERYCLPDRKEAAKAA
jgi:transposase